MKKILVFIAAFIFALAMVGCTKKNEGADNSLKRVMDSKQLVLGLDDSFPPMGFRDETNEIVGYDIDLAQEVASRLGITLVKQPIDWNAKEQELSTGQIDCIWNGFTITEERKNALLFSPPYLKNAQIIVVKSDSPITSKADLAGKKVGTQTGSSSVEAIDEDASFKESLADVIEYKTFLDAFMDLDVGGVDAVVADLVVANDSIGRFGKPLRKLDDRLSEEEFGIGFRKTDAALQAKVWETLTAMAADGTIAQISAKWFGEDISVIGK